MERETLGQGSKYGLRHEWLCCGLFLSHKSDEKAFAMRRRLRCMDKMSKMITPQEKKLISTIRETKEGSILVKIENSQPSEIEREPESGKLQ